MCVLFRRKIKRKKMANGVGVYLLANESRSDRRSKHWGLILCPLLIEKSGVNMPHVDTTYYATCQSLSLGLAPLLGSTYKTQAVVVVVVCC